MIFHRGVCLQDLSSLPIDAEGINFVHASLIKRMWSDTIANLVRLLFKAFGCKRVSTKCLGSPDRRRLVHFGHLGSLIIFGLLSLAWRHFISVVLLLMALLLPRHDWH